ncbi:MAG: hypothetical protein AMXMBFR19_02330 [Chthonomonadaceae bacterium]|uniref:DUF5916 domain-containing protein n=1 Tax=Candidatus Nitrosymbiomonas proteolyticus TaxID=2608984 RepID=A0A809S3A4_9BACT|nr:conserved hypothetical protein [Candidatus Nitrosymbiomonas proteolyticus]
MRQTCNLAICHNDYLTMRGIVVTALLLCSTWALAERNRMLPGKKLDSPPVIDGVIDAYEWGQAEKSGQFVHLATGQRTSYDCELYAGYDEQALYFAFFCPDPRPDLIRATEYRRNVSLNGNDNVIVLVNPFATHQESDTNEFKVSAGGGTRAEFAGGRASKREWEGEWQARTRITDAGWECEIRIPWKILRLPPAGVRNLEVNFGREIPREQLTVAWCDLGPQEQRKFNGFWLDVAVPELSEPNPLLVLGYQTIGYDDEQRAEVLDTGLDIRYDINPQLTSLASINPDFRNIEGSVLSLEFSRFERLAEERRPFFVEGSSAFRMGGMSASLFAPQRIRQFDFGAKVFGKVSDRALVGALATTRFGHESAAAARYRLSWGTQSSLTAGAVHFDDPDDNLTNTAAALELTQLEGPVGMALLYNTTHDSDLGTAHRYDADLLYRHGSVYGQVGYQHIDENFLPRIGFSPRVGFRGWNGFLEDQRSYTAGPLSELGFALGFRDTQALDGSGVYLRGIEAGVEFTTRSDLNVETFAVREDFRGEVATLGGFELSYPDSNPYHRMSFGYLFGDVEGEDYSLVSLGLQKRFSNRITVGPFLQFEREGSTTRTQHILGASYEVDRYRSISGRAVVRDDKWSGYLSFRYSGNLGVEYYLVLGDPNADSFQRRLILKAVFPVR